MKIVMTFWAFDLVHPWHEYYLSEAKKLWDKLITVVARDVTIEKIKWKKPLYSEDLRILDIRKLWLSDIVELWHKTDILKWIKKYKPDVVAIWYDQNSFIHQLSEYLHKHKLKTTIVTIDSYRADIYKSSKIKNKN